MADSSCSLASHQPSNSGSPSHLAKSNATSTATVPSGSESRTLSAPQTSFEIGASYPFKSTLPSSAPNIPEISYEAHLRFLTENFSDVPSSRVSSEGSRDVPSVPRLSLSVSVQSTPTIQIKDEAKNLLGTNNTGVTENDPSKEKSHLETSTSDVTDTLKDGSHKDELSDFGEHPKSPIEHGEIDITESGGYQCHLCNFQSAIKEEFNQHVNGHYDFRCIKCEYQTKDEDDYRAHLKDNHDLTPEEIEDEQGVRVPRINSQGKVKTFKCKQCEFIAVTKEDFWQHSRIHIKAEKMLTCPKCSFVTEYKHHLEYHLRNHFGSKPYKCKNCNYSCVNKSMLNSHMKSHTNIYQYRCADCSYATKYCHSLKLHLRKYSHKPSMVLNPDGTPNPLPIIDVYGTRRGPKVKKDDEGNVVYPVLPPYVLAQMQKTQTDSAEYSSNVEDESSSTSPTEETVTTTPLFKCSLCDFNTNKEDVYDNHVMYHESKDSEIDFEREAESPKNDFDASDSVEVEEDKEIGLESAEDKPEEIEQENSPLGYLEYLKRISPFLTNAANDNKISTSSSTPLSQDILSRFFLMKKFNRSMEDAVLDLSHSNSESESSHFQAQRQESAQPVLLSTFGQTSSKGNSADASVKSSGSSSTSSNGTKLNRRKGRAFKIKRLSSEDNAEDTCKSPSENHDLAGNHVCHFCQVAFSLTEMYALHKKLHAPDNPFKCNFCGLQLNNNIEFYKHITKICN